MIQHFKFIGGPWDGEYHEVDTNLSDVCVAISPKFSTRLEPIEEVVFNDCGEPLYDEDGELVMRMIPPKPTPHTRYTLRHWAGEGGDLYWYAPDDWTDMYTLSQLVHHYPGRP